MINIKNNDFFIHFDTADECNRFRKTYYGMITEHICCNGKGCKIIGVSSYDEVYKIKNEFLNGTTSRE